MPMKKTIAQQVQAQSSDHVKRAYAEVRAWPEWKKAFASDVYSVSINRFEAPSVPKRKAKSE
jgi:hypothetical protein